MARRVFYSFHYKPDSQRASQVRQMNQFESQEILSSNKWEEVKESGDAAVYEWIDEQMKYKSCIVVLIGAATANRKFINYEISEAWNKKKGIVGIDIHRLKNLDGETSAAGANPFDFITAGGVRLSNYLSRHASPYTDSQQTYAHIRDNIAGWIDTAIAEAAAR